MIGVTRPSITSTQYRVKGASPCRSLLSGRQTSSLRHDFPVRGGAQPLHDVNLARVFPNQDPRFAPFDTLQDSGSSSFRRCRSDFIKERDRFVLLAFGRASSEPRMPRDRRMYPAWMHARHGYRSTFELVP